MRDIFQILSERKIQEALKKGDFDNLPGKGSPLVFEDSHIPSEGRMLYKMMKNAGIQPDEVALKKEIEILTEQLKTAINEKEKKLIQQKISDKQIHFDVLMEKRRKGK